MTDTKPYLIRAIYEWCMDNSFTPYLSVEVDDYTQVPMTYVQEGQITLNVSTSATRQMMMANDYISFSSRFNGVAHEIIVPVNRVVGIFARENGQGLAFVAEPSPEAPEPQSEAAKPSGKPNLRIVK